MTGAIVALAAALTGATPSPVPEPVAGTGPGLVGFLVTLALVVVCIPLFRSMVRMGRGVAYRDPAGGAPDDARTS